MSNVRNLENKVAVITGGSTGIGLASAKLFQQQGAQVVITGRNEASLAAASKELGDKVLALRSDTSKLDDIAGLASQVKQKFGRTDVLFLNAGIAKFAPLEASPEALFDELFAINVKGAFFALQQFLPQLGAGASVIFNTSVVNGQGYPGTGLYSATKAALRSIVRVAAAELAPMQIRVNAVSPGPIATPIYDKLGMPKEQLDGFTASMAEQVPLKRFGTPEELAQAALFLASSQSSYITGVELNVDGGLGQV